MIQWNKIETVLLDMDGTLLDLHFDNHFWREYVMHRYAAIHGIPLDRVRPKLLRRMQETQGTLDWYCLDFWSNELKLDILALKREIEHLIRLHPHAEEFLKTLHGWRPMTLVTDAHPEVLKLKLQRTGISVYFDAIVSSHEFRQPKSTRQFWQQLRQRMEFEPQRTLLVEDSAPVLEAARQFGIGHLLAISRPDSREALKDFDGIPAISDFGKILPIKR